MVRSIAPTSMLYSVETSGISNTGLHTVRVATGLAACAKARAKNPDIALLLLDGNSGTLDPAFDTHTNPIKYCALSVWERLYGDDDSAEAILEARK